MPILERDPWRDQYFAGVNCPDNVTIPTDDIDAWPMFPAHNWVYDRLRVAVSQGLTAAPHGTAPASYPVFSKPIINLRGMGAGSCAIHNAGEMKRALTPGHFWMPMFEGEHLSTDCAIVKGKVQWMRHALGKPADDGMFRYWKLLRPLRKGVAGYLKQWVASYMQDYTGMMNFETIGGKIIEAHLRFADQWVDLNGAGWAEAVTGLYTHGTWHFADSDQREGYSIPLFVKPDRVFHHPPAEVQGAVRAMRNVSSLQITFHDGVDPALHPMPPGGMRLALVNSWNLDDGKAALRQLAAAFPAETIIQL